MLGQIQKRRRRSTPNSPASPTALWHASDIAEEKPNAASQEEFLHHTVTGSESPALEVDVPSPTVDLPSISPGPSKDKRSGSFVLPRYSDQNGPHPSRPVAEQPRPATSSSYTPRLENQQTGKRRVFSSSLLDPSFAALTPPSSRGGESPSPDVGSRSGDREAYSNRNYSHSSLVVNSSPLDETPPFRFPNGKKSRLNFRNPLSLLARRKSSQNQNTFEDVGLRIKTQSVPDIPDDYDPRIRGNIFHDFSAPRNRRIQSSLDANTTQTASPGLRSTATEHIRSASDLSGLKDIFPKHSSQSPSHSPIFKEHFQDDQQNLRPAQTGYLHSLALSDKNVEINNVSVPAFAKKLPVVLAESPKIREDAPTRPPPPPPQEEGILDDIPEASTAASVLIDGVDSSNTTTSESLRKKPRSLQGIRRASGLPKHMNSTSSRFSFIRNGDSAAQEKLLEERHKQHASNNEAAGLDETEPQEDHDYDDYDMDADDGLEEAIPGVNADASDDEEYMQRPISEALNSANKKASLKIDPDAANDYARKDHLQSFHFTPEPLILSAVSTGQTSQPTPRDEYGRVIGLADTSYSPPRRANGHGRQRSKNSIMEISGGLAGLGLLTTQTDTKPQSLPEQLPSPQHEPFRDEDLYFDDGEFDDLVEETNGEELDEKIFDEGNETIRDIPAENARKLEEAQPRSLKPTGAFDATNTTSAIVTTGLTEGNLAAYHAALVSAADAAAANGRFTRSISNSQYSADQPSSSQLEDSPPGLSADDKRNSHKVEFTGFDDGDGFAFDDNDEDDLIAEANAEVLENDDDDFYGQEFGFYARAMGKNNSEPEYGGYFATRGTNGIRRSHSAKANFQEPSLTPITERSERSARNSIAVLIPGMPGSAQPVPSPGLSQILDFESPSFDENISFEALMKLRRGAFGGSSTSINSMGGLPNSSPLAHISTHTFSDSNHRMTSSVHSLTGSAGIPESEEEDGDMWEQPMFTRNFYKNDLEASAVRSPESATTLSPLSVRSEKGRIGHSRNSSGAESVSYVKDTDGRWLLERRRTGDDGEGEVIGREYLAGSRI